MSSRRISTRADLTAAPSCRAASAARRSAAGPSSSSSTGRLMYTPWRSPPALVTVVVQRGRRRSRARRCARRCERQVEPEFVHRRWCSAALRRRRRERRRRRQRRRRRCRPRPVELLSGGATPSLGLARNRRGASIPTWRRGPHPYHKLAPAAACAEEVHDRDGRRRAPRSSLARRAPSRPTGRALARLRRERRPRRTGGT